MKIRWNGLIWLTANGYKYYTKNGGVYRRRNAQKAVLRHVECKNYKTHYRVKIQRGQFWRTARSVPHYLLFYYSLSYIGAIGKNKISTIKEFVVSFSVTLFLSLQLSNENRIFAFLEKIEKVFWTRFWIHYLLSAEITLYNVPSCEF